MSQWRFGDETWGIALFCVWRSANFFGFTLLGFVFEWAADPHAELSDGQPWFC